jgi:hypothetical protein
VTSASVPAPAAPVKDRPGTHPRSTARAAHDRRTASAAERAAAEVLDRHTIQVTLPDGIGTIRLPSPQRMVYYGGIGALAAFGIIEWPVALVIGIGHLLAEDHHHKCLAEFGEVLGEV